MSILFSSMDLLQINLRSLYFFLFTFKISTNTIHFKLFTLIYYSLLKAFRGVFNAVKNKLFRNFFFVGELAKRITYFQQISLTKTGGGGGGLTKERPGSDHVTSGPMRGIEKNCTQWRKHTSGHGDSMTNSAKWGRVGEKHYVFLFFSPDKFIGSSSSSRPSICMDRKNVQSI